MSDSASLAEALALAARDPASRPAFYRRLLAADVFVIGHSDGAGDGSSVLPAGAQLSLVHWGKPDGTTAIPFFTSLQALQQGLREEARYLSLSARSLFEMTRGATLVLDPASDYGKEFTPGEVDALLAHGGHPTAVQRTVAEDTQVLLGQPAHYPTAMIEALSRRLPGQPTVEAAYLCLMHDPQQSPAPSLVVGLAVDGELAPVLPVRHGGRGHRAGRAGAGFRAGGARRGRAVGLPAQRGDPVLPPRRLRARRATGPGRRPASGSEALKAPRRHRRGRTRPCRSRGRHRRRSARR